MPRNRTESIAKGLIRPRPRKETIGADWGMLDAELLRESISAVTLRGGALRFGYTRDGGAYALGIYGLGEPYTEYIRPSEDVEGFLQEVMAAFRDQVQPVVAAVDAGQAPKVVQSG